MEDAEQTTSSSNGDGSTSCVSLDKYERLTAWLQQNGGTCQHVEFREYESGSSDVNDEYTYFKYAELRRRPEEKERNVHASTDIPKDTMLISVPRHCILTADMGRALPLGKKLAECDTRINAPRHIYLILYMLWDMKTNGSDSFFFPYYDVLPKSFPHIPIFWSPDELKHLEGSFLFSEIMERNRSIWEDYCTVCRIVEKEAAAHAQKNEINNDDPNATEASAATYSWFHNVSLADFQWARVAITSRNFAFVDRTTTRVSAMVPQADMLNHRRPPDAMWTFDIERDAFTIRTLVDVPAGAPIYESYGRKSNHRYLLNYGFSVENNFDEDGTCPNQVDIDLEVSPTDPVFLRKMKFWLSDMLSDRDILVYYHHVPERFQVGTIKSETYHIDEAQNDDSVGHKVDSRVDHADADGNDDLAEHHVVSDRSEHDPTIPSTVSSPPSERLFHVHDEKEVGDEPETDEDDDDIDLLCEDYLESDRDLIYRRKTLRVSVSDDENTTLLFSLLRALACNEEDLNLLTGTTMERKDSGTSCGVRTLGGIVEPINLRNEFMAMILLTEIMIDHLARFPTTIEEDVADLADEGKYPAFSNRRNAKIQVKSEKEVLCHFLLWAQSATYVMRAMLRESNDSVGIDSDLVEDGESKTPTVEEAIDELHEAEVHWSIIRYCDLVLWKLRGSVKKDDNNRSSALSTAVEDDDEHIDGRLDACINGR